MNIESKKAPLSQMRRQGKRVPEPAREDEKKSVKDTKRGGKPREKIQNEGRQRQEERVMKRQPGEGCGVK